MALRTGSLSSELAREDPDLLQMLLDDYKTSFRRDRSSRIDFASGWLACLKRLKPSLFGTVGSKTIEQLPW